MTTVSDYLIPLVNTPQTFEILLAGTTYTLTSKWNDMAQCWFLDIADQNANPLACGIPFITGADLLDGLEYLGIGGALIVFTNGLTPDAVPTLYNLGTDTNLYFQTSSTDE
jgi:hypothetical protein